MSNDNGKKGQGLGFEEFMKRGSYLSSADQLKQSAKELLPVVRALRQSSPEMLKLYAQMAHFELQNPDPMRALTLSLQLVGALDRNRVRESLVKGLGLDILTDDGKAMVKAHSLKETGAALSKDDMLALSRVFYDVMPQSVQTVMQAGAKTQAQRDQRVRREYHRMQNQTVEQVRDELVAKVALYPLEPLLDVIETVAAKADPEVLESLSRNFAKAVNVGDLMHLATSGLAFADEFLTNAMEEKAFNGAYSDEAKAFGPALQKALQALEDSAITVGLTPTATQAKALVDGYAAHANAGTKRGRPGPKGPSL